MKHHTFRDGDSQVQRAGYNEWVESYLKDTHARDSDASMANLKAALADDVAVSTVTRLGPGKEGRTNQVNMAASR